MSLLYDNVIFDMNGQGQELLLLALRSALLQSTHGVKGWSQHPKAGMVLHWCWRDNDNVMALPTSNTGLTAEDVAPLVNIWLSSDAAKITAELNTGEDADPCDSDVHIEHGWRVYIPTYERDDVSHYSIICAIKPVCLWLGK